MLAAVASAASALAACVPRSQWPSSAISDCGRFSYTAHSASDFAKASAAITFLRAELADTLVTPSCLGAITDAECLRSIPACGSDGAPVLPCTEVCDEMHKQCAGAFAEASSRGEEQALRLRSLSACHEWRTVWEDSSLPVCPAFSATTPCVSAEAAALSRGVFGTAGSWCPKGLNGNQTETDAVAERPPLVLTHESANKEMDYLVWPVCMVAGLLLALSSVGGGVRRGSRAKHVLERVTSIRFCTQFLLIMVAEFSGMAVYFLVTTTNLADFDRAFDATESAHQRASDLLRGRLRAASYSEAACLAATIATEVRTDLELFQEVHNITVEHVARTGVNPRPTVNGAPEVLHAFLAAVERSDNLKELTLACVVLTVGLSSSGNTTTLLLQPQAEQVIGAYTTAGEMRHLGYVGSTPRFFDLEGRVLPGITPQGFAMVPYTVPSGFSVVLLRGTEMLTGPRVTFAHLVLDLVSTIYDGLLRPTANVATLFDLEALRSRVRSQMKEGSRVVVARADTSDAPLLVSSDGLLKRDASTPIPSLQVTDTVAQSLLSALLTRTGVSSVSDLPDGTSETLHDLHGSMHVVATKRLNIGSLLTGVVISMIPVYSLEGTTLGAINVLEEQVRSEHRKIKEEEDDGRQFLVFVIVLVMIFAFLVSFAVSVAMTGGLNRLAADLDSVSNMHLDAVARSRSVTHPSRLAEVREMQGRIRVLVAKLLEIRHYLPDLSVIAGDKGGDGEEEHEDEDIREQDMINERTCTVRITHVSRKALRRQAEPIAPGSPSGITSTGPNSALAGATKKVSSFDWHYHDPSNASLIDLLKECRAAVGEPPGEPLMLTAMVPAVGDVFSDFEEYAIVYSHHLQDLLTFSPDEIILVSQKSSKVSFISPLVALMSAFGKLGLFWMVLRMWRTDGSRNVAVILAATLLVSFAVNILLGFKLNHKATRTDEQMRDWTAHFQTETTVVMVLCGFNVQNMLVLWSGLRVLRFLRFNAPMPRPIRNQAIRWSMFSLVVGDVMPLVIVLYFLVSESLFDTNSLITLFLQVGAMLGSSVKKFVVFCLVDDKAAAEAELIKERRQRAQDRIRRLSEVTATIVRMRLTDFQELAECMPAPRLSQVVNRFYEACILAVRQHKGTVVRFDDGYTEALFNYPVLCPRHERLACSAVAQVLAQKPPPEVDDLDGGGSAAGWITASVVTGTVQAGNLGSGQRKVLHCIGTLAALSPRLCQHNCVLATGALVNAAVAQKLEEQVGPGRNHSAEFIVRPVDLVVLPSGRVPEEVFQLMPARALLQGKALALAGNLDAYKAAWASLKRDEMGDCATELKRYLGLLNPVQDPVARQLLDRVLSVDYLEDFVGGATRLEEMSVRSSFLGHPRRRSQQPVGEASFNPKAVYSLRAVSGWKRSPGQDPLRRQPRKQSRERSMTWEVSLLDVTSPPATHTHGTAQAPAVSETHSEAETAPTCGGDRTPPAPPPAGGGGVAAGRPGTEPAGPPPLPILASSPRASPPRPVPPSRPPAGRAAPAAVRAVGGAAPGDDPPTKRGAGRGALLRAAERVELGASAFRREMGTPVESVLDASQSVPAAGAQRLRVQSTVRLGGTRHRDVSPERMV